MMWGHIIVVRLSVTIAVNGSVIYRDYRRSECRFHLLVWLFPQHVTETVIYRGYTRSDDTLMNKDVSTQKQGTNKAFEKKLFQRKGNNLNLN